MNRRPLRYWLQLGLTLLVCAFLVVPVVMSILAGVTQNYFIGVKSGLTLRWVGEVWALYSDTIWRSIYIALATLAVTLALGIPAAYALARAQSRWTRWIEELLTLPIAGAGPRDRARVDPPVRPVARLPCKLALHPRRATCSSRCPSWCDRCSPVMLAVDLRTLEEAAASLGASFASASSA
jgi:putative spermidine/putrescine transport system permease protein